MRMNGGADLIESLLTSKLAESKSAKKGLEDMKLLLRYLCWLKYKLNYIYSHTLILFDALFSFISRISCVSSSCIDIVPHCPMSIDTATSITAWTL